MESQHRLKSGSVGPGGTDAWMEPRPQNIPRPTYSPAVLALGIVCVLWGFVTTYLISVLGLILFAVGLSGWIGELRNERPRK